MKPKSRDVALDLVHIVFSDALVLRLALLLELPRTLKQTHGGGNHNEHSDINAKAEADGDVKPQ